ncbi:hypothetical protein ABT352_33295 [Streptosporangium sp. NPDC000563]|uniref:hypothetical protein n=1 Tax=Streptosporangium sp. NPDC000563 TaxID=3154366 RepID=UPI00332273AA
MAHPPHQDGYIAAEPTLNGAQAARVGVSAAAREIAEHAARLVPTTDDAHATPGDLLTHSIRLRRMTLELMFRTVTAERMRGTPWESIADHLHMTVDEVTKEFGHADLTHHATAPGQVVWDILAQTCINPIPGGCAPTPDEAATELDAWYERWQQPDNHPTQPPTCAVTAHL